MSSSDKWAVVDEESATKVGEVATVLGRFDSLEEAEAYIADHPDQEKVERGGFGIDSPTEGDDMDLPQAVELMGADIEDALRQGAVMLKGDVVSVQLYATVEDAQTPQEAVDRFIRMITHAGFDSFYFAVTDQEAGETHYVRAGQLLNLGEIEAVVEGQDDGN